MVIAIDFDGTTIEENADFYKFVLKPNAKEVINKMKKAHEKIIECQKN